MGTVCVVTVFISMSSSWSSLSSLSSTHRDAFLRLLVSLVSILLLRGGPRGFKDVVTNIREESWKVSEKGVKKMMRWMVVGVALGRDRQKEVFEPSGEKNATTSTPKKRRTTNKRTSDTVPNIQDTVRTVSQAVSQAVPVLGKVRIKKQTPPKDDDFLDPLLQKISGAMRERYDEIDSLLEKGIGRQYRTTSSVQETFIVPVTEFPSMALNRGLDLLRLRCRGLSPQKMKIDPFCNWPTYCGIIRCNNCLSRPLCSRIRSLYGFGGHRV